ncbi:pirin family protein [Arthrobacter sp. BL-252-APC-1A]|uniref:pirin family protein n=1 Tax=Arthrobacter sp. BL-252-APC-1A TaxID=2606622 RepID=UPI0012B3F456|nr:pirin family protein [Arthrobacter sp. BL-252-APC-1A]MSS00192.1 pirin family protein [Arthrobacter sp. BL-252-APC-1A]
MSNIETAPLEVECASTPAADVEIHTPRDVPLGGPRAMPVRRTLPQRSRSLIGAWCFVDHYGPDAVTRTGGMVVPPHPHTGLQTVSWLFAGEIEHRDSSGAHAMVRPGEVNLMTAGRGIAHSEVSTPQTATLHGVQLWLALPETSRHTDPRFEHYAPEPVRGGGWDLRVFLGELAGSASPVRVHSPILGAEICLEPGAVLELDADPRFEYGLLADTGELRFQGTGVVPGELAYVPTGNTTLRISASADAAVRAVLIGGEPLGETIVMWWNFIGRSHEEIVQYRRDWQQHIGAESHPGADPADRFAVVPNDPLPPLPAPDLPNARLRPRS